MSAGEVVGIDYVGTALPTLSTTETLFDTSDLENRDFLNMANLRWFRYSVSNSHSGTVKGYESDDGGTNWEQFYDSGLLAAPAATATNDDDVLVEGKRDLKFEWVNGGSTQTTFRVHLSLAQRT